MQKSIIATFCPCNVLSMRLFVHATICPCDVLSMRRFVHATNFLRRFVRNILSATLCPRPFVLQRIVLRHFVHATFCPQRFVRDDLSCDILSGHLSDRVSHWKCTQMSTTVENNMIFTIGTDVYCQMPQHVFNCRSVRSVIVSVLQVSKRKCCRRNYVVVVERWSIALLVSVIFLLEKVIESDISRLSMMCWANVSKIWIFILSTINEYHWVNQSSWNNGKN
jgi:hypothetical protein